MSEPGDTFSIVVTVAPEQRRADLILSGDMDISANPVLTDAVDRVAAVAPNVTVVDLAAISFAGSVLLNFLARVHQALPADSALVVCRPPPVTRRILEIAAMEWLAAIRDRRARELGGSERQRRHERRVPPGQQRTPTVHQALRPLGAPLPSAGLEPGQVVRGFDARAAGWEPDACRGRFRRQPHEDPGKLEAAELRADRRLRLRRPVLQPGHPELRGTWIDVELAERTAG
jgi:anti-anti-sigma factor